MIAQLLQTVIDLGQDLDNSLFEDSQPESWKKGQALLGLCQCSDFDEAEVLLRERVLTRMQHMMTGRLAHGCV